MLVLWGCALAAGLGKLGSAAASLVEVARLEVDEWKLPAVLANMGGQFRGCVEVP